MKKIIYKLIILLAIVIAFDQGYGKVCNYLVEHPKGGSGYLDKYICDSTTADILIFGSSKAKNQYDPEILEDTLGMSVFNCGTHGMGIIYQVIEVVDGNKMAIADQEMQNWIQKQLIMGR